MIGQWLIYSKLPRLLDVLFRMKKDTTNEMVTFSNKMDEALYPIIKNDIYRVLSFHIGQIQSDRYEWMFEIHVF